MLGPASDLSLYDFGVIHVAYYPVYSDQPRGDVGTKRRTSHSHARTGSRLIKQYVKLLSVMLHLNLVQYFGIIFSADAIVLDQAT